MKWLKDLARCSWRRKDLHLSAFSRSEVDVDVPMPLEGPYSHENYPGNEISACLRACRSMTERKVASVRIWKLCRKIEFITKRHQALLEAVEEFNDRAACLRQEILTLTLGMRSLQELGISTIDIKARRAELSERGEELKRRRTACEAEASVLDARVQEMILQVNDLRNKTAVLLSRKSRRAKGGAVPL